MNYHFKSSFLRLFKRLEKIKQKQVIEAIEALKTVVEADVQLDGLGLKKLSKNIWEMRSSLKDRIIFSYDKADITFILVGNHDDVRRFLKGN